MRITGGKLKGRNIKCPDGIIRPAMDRMRESVFSILGDLDGKSWLDLFSGSGTIAIEAASRGASRVELCEKDRVKVRQVLENVSVTEKECGVRISCHFLSVELFLKKCKDSFDYIFLDPPFPYKFRLELMNTISERNILNPDGIAMIHFPEEDMLPERVGNLILSDKRVYGRSIVHFYKKKAVSDAENKKNNI